ncbi:MAG: Hsp33 family molecular chaperone HslO, partial [Anaerovoracaceae bacterium]|nr:Hsp33 family molecular chaperone HslO [Anaerovoracaceae bacterium]
LIDRIDKKEPDVRLRYLLKEIFEGIPEEFAVEELEIRNMDWNCDCSFERLEKVLMTIGEKDLKEIIEEDGEAELVCQFCLEKYKFDKAHLEKILASIR